MNTERYLILENGRVFKGQAFGASGSVTGEVVFTTSMTGYLETLTDPSFYGQLVVQTFPLIGNYGFISADLESASPFLKAYIVREWCHEPSNFRSEGELDTFLKARGVIGLYDIDTRALTKIIREHGVMNARISDTPTLTRDELAQLTSFKIEGAVNAVTCRTPYTVGEGGARRVVLWDFGTKHNIARELVQRGCEVIVMPAESSAAEIMAQSPEGIMLSNGPGDPAENEGVIAELRSLCAHKLPTFGICLGHQLLALAQGAERIKLKYGHRGANQPVRETDTGRVFVTSQNHGYAVLSDTLPAGARDGYVNVNDGTCEGVEYSHIPAFSVQFHPEACAGPLDTRFLFDRFIRMMEEKQ